MAPRLKVGHPLLTICHLTCGTDKPTWEANLKIEHDLPDPFSRREMETILGYLRDHEPEQVWNWYEFAITTGVRPSEKIALRWEDVDWDGGTIRVQRARVRGEVKSTKNHRVRDVMLSDRARAVLLR